MKYPALVPAQRATHSQPARRQVNAHPQAMSVHLSHVPLLPEFASQLQTLGCLHRSRGRAARISALTPQDLPHPPPTHNPPLPHPPLLLPALPPPPPPHS